MCARLVLVFWVASSVANANANRLKNLFHHGPKWLCEFDWAISSTVKCGWFPLYLCWSSFTCLVSSLLVRYIYTIKPKSSAIIGGLVLYYRVTQSEWISMPKCSHSSHKNLETDVLILNYGKTTQSPWKPHYYFIIFHHMALYFHPIPVIPPFCVGEIPMKP